MRFMLAIFTINSTLQPTLWHLHSDINGTSFAAVDTPPGILDRIYGNDLIAMWHKIIQEDLEKANEPDIDIPMSSQVVKQSGRPGSAPSQPGSPPSSPPSSPPGIPEIPG